MIRMAATTGAVPNTLQRSFSHCSDKPSTVMIANVIPKRMKPVKVFMPDTYHLMISGRRKKD